MPSFATIRTLTMIAAAAFLTSLPGCSSAGSKTLPAATPVSGSLARGDGTAIGNVTLMLQPLSSGHMTSFEVGPDGAFHGEAIAGPYAWFVTKSTKAADADAAIAKIPEEFHRGSIERKVTVGATPLRLSVP